MSHVDEASPPNSGDTITTPLDEYLPDTALARVGALGRASAPAKTLVALSSNSAAGWPSTRSAQDRFADAPRHACGSEGIDGLDGQRARLARRLHHGRRGTWREDEGFPRQAGCRTESPRPQPSRATRVPRFHPGHPYWRSAKIPIWPMHTVNSLVLTDVTRFGTSPRQCGHDSMSGPATDVESPSTSVTSIVVVMSSRLRAPWWPRPRRSPNADRRRAQASALAGWLDEYDPGIPTEGSCAVAFTG